MVNDYGLTPNPWRPLETPSLGPDAPTRPLTDELARQVWTEYGSVFGSTPYLTHWGYTGTWKPYATQGVPPGEWVLLDRIETAWLPLCAWSLILIPMWADYSAGGGFLQVVIWGIDRTGAAYELGEALATAVLNPLPGRMFACGILQLTPWVPWVVPLRTGMTFATGVYTGDPPTSTDRLGSPDLQTLTYPRPPDLAADIFHTDAPIWDTIEVRSRVWAGGVGGLVFSRSALYIGCDVWAVLPTYWRS